MDNQDANNTKEPNDSPVTPPVPNGVPPQVDSEEEKELLEINKLETEEEREVQADAKIVDDREKESKEMEQWETKDPKLIVTENATPSADTTSQSEKT